MSFNIFFFFLQIPYPNNLLRNIALSKVQTTHVFVIDIDMLPNVNVEDEFLELTFKNSNDKNGKDVKVQNNQGFAEMIHRQEALLWLNRRPISCVDGFPNIPSQYGKLGLYPDRF